MKIYFLHNETKNKIDLDYIKNNLDKMCLFHDYKTGKQYEYDCKFIPISNDFSIECVDEEFTTEELYEMIYTYRNYNSNNQLLQKLKNKFDEKRRYEMLRGY